MLVLKNIAQVVTLRGGPGARTGEAMSELGIIENGAIMIRGDRIMWIGPTKKLPVRERKEEHQILDAVGLEVIALPGFVDAHTHPIFAGTRAGEYDLRSAGKSYQDIAAAGGGIAASVRQLRAATLDQLVERAERYFRLFLSHGTTTIEAKTGYGLSAEVVEEPEGPGRGARAVAARSDPDFPGSACNPGGIQPGTSGLSEAADRRDDPQGSPGEPG